MPIWLCTECEGVAYGWARGPCIHCGSPRIVGTDVIRTPNEFAPHYRLVHFTAKQWAQFAAEVVVAGRPPQEMVAEREGVEVVLMREEPVANGQLFLLKAEKTRNKSQSG